MQQKTRGIILHALQYNDKYAIVHIYTECSGRVSYLVSRQRGRKTAVSRAVFMPLSVVEMDAIHLNKRDIQRLKEVRPLFQPMAMTTDPVKNAIGLFLAEVLYRVVKDKEGNPPFFEFLVESIRWLEEKEQGIPNFHLIFLMHLPRFYGIFPNTARYTKNCFFDMLNAEFVTQPPLHAYFLNPEETLAFYRLLKMNYETSELYAFSRHERVAVIQRILEYYRLHLPDFPEIKSLAIMQSLFE